MMTPFAIIGSQRSGTTFLRRSLNDHPQIVCHGEIFRPAGVETFRRAALRSYMPGKEKRDADPVGYLDRLLSFYDSGFIGFKLLLAHSETVLREISQRQYRLIVLQRENSLAKYSSLMIFMAMRGSGDRFKRPANDGPQAVKTRFDPDAFDKYMEDETERWAAFQSVIRQYVPPSLELEYADMVWGDGLDVALDFLGAPRRPLEAGIIKQNSTDIVSRFENADAVRDYLVLHQLDRWAIEGPEAVADAAQDVAPG